MTFTKIKNIKHLTTQEIEEKIITLKKDILKLEIKKATRQTFKPHIFKHKKHELAQLLTLETQKL
uniref:Ribosomal protein L29 n=1 Tax=Mastocarpus papillatus TaxID=31436 RepID=A0A342RZH1_9FLOR|nr:ribosomal protein L29 [Mastocarpus papillatus]AOL58117.1 ribosomal protein L29 [Mastocarpus papillatus]